MASAAGAQLLKDWKAWYGMVKTLRSGRFATLYGAAAAAAPATGGGWTFAPDAGLSDGVMTIGLLIMLMLKSTPATRIKSTPNFQRFKVMRKVPPRSPGGPCRRSTWWFQ